MFKTAGIVEKTRDQREEGLSVSLQSMLAASRNSREPEVAARNSAAPQLWVPRLVDVHLPEPAFVSEHDEQAFLADSCHALSDSERNRCTVKALRKRMFNQLQFGS